MTAEVEYNGTPNSNAAFSIKVFFNTNGTVGLNGFIKDFNETIS